VKNILLLGASRSGKSTFARMLDNKYQIIDGDSIRGAYKNVINNDITATSMQISENDEYRKLLTEIFKKLIRYNKDLRYVLDTVDLLPSDNHLFAKRHNVIIIALGYPNAKAQDVVCFQKQYDTPDDWTYGLSDKELLDNANYWIKKSIEYKDICEKLNIKFVDTSVDRNKVLEELLNWVTEQNK